jgi:hypothetical protein
LPEEASASLKKTDQRPACPAEVSNAEELNGTGDGPVELADGLVVVQFEI